MAKRREFSIFSLSFLDVMACGFGAVILIFIVIQHSTETVSQEINLELLAEIKELEVEVLEETENLVELKTTLKETDDEIVTTEDLILAILSEIKELQARIKEFEDSGSSQTAAIDALKTELKQLNEEAASLKGSVAAAEQSGVDSRSFIGRGDRQYLTGLHLGGEHILILLDTSASMLDDTIVNIIRRRNMEDEDIRASKKWQRAIRTIDWIVANLPVEANMQLFTFNTEAKPLIPGTETSWIRAADREDIDQALSNLQEIIPKGGTSLHHPFALARQMKPVPDSIFLIVDSLPTMGFTPGNQTSISGSERVGLFGSAMDELPLDTPVNVILFPMEGDPIAAPSFWRLAQITGGSFLSPSKDWP